jgi:tetratricopeptide (TPR) repeat protein
VKVLSIIVFVVTLFAVAAVPAQSGQADIKRVQELIETGELDEAMEVANAYIADNPQDPRMRFLKGLILTNKSAWQGAIKEFRTLSNDFPDLPAPLNNLAVVYAETGNYDLAQEALKEALAINPAYASAHENLGDIYVTLAALSYRQATSHDEKQQSARAKLKVLGQLIPDLADASPAVQTIPHRANY